MIRLVVAAAATAFALAFSSPASAQVDKARLLNDAVHAMDAQNFDIAEGLISDILQDNPRDLLALIMAGILEVARQDYPDAKRHFELAAKIAPRQPDPIGRLGWVYAKSGDKAAAGRQREKLVDFARACQRTHCQYADTIAAGIAIIDSATTDTDGPGSYFGKGVEAIQAKDWDAANTAFTELLKEAPTNPGANLMLGVVRIGQKNLPEARTYLETAIRLSPKMSDPVGRLGWVYVQLNEDDAARQQLARLQAMQRDCKGKCYDKVTIERGIWMITGVLDAKARGIPIDGAQD